MSDKLPWRVLNDDIEYLLDYSVVIPPEKTDIFVEGFPLRGYREPNYLGLLDARCRHCKKPFGIHYFVRGILVVGYYKIDEECEHKNLILSHFSQSSTPTANDPTKPDVELMRTLTERPK